MYCGQCGSENVEEAGTCTICGAPLLITAGARTCGQCGASLGDNDQYCPTCGASASKSFLSETYEADDSFESPSGDDINVDELPAWLRDMAPGAADNQQSQSPSPDDLPDWLRDASDAPAESPTMSAESSVPRGQPPSPASQGVQHHSAEQFSLVSGDDLPEWLRALGDDELPSSSPATARAEQEPETRAVAMIFEVPQVHRAWMNVGRSPDPAAVRAARQDFASLTERTGGVHQFLPEYEEEPAPPERYASSDFDTQFDDAPGNVDDRNETTGTGLPIALIIKIVTVLILVAVISFLVFYVIQGM